MLIVDGKLISDDIIEKQFVCQISKCKGACCWKGDYGAPIAAEEIEIIETILELIKEYLPEANLSMISTKGWYKYYKGMSKTGTQLMPDKACVFMTKSESGCASCAFEQAHTDGKTTFKKPISCHLYPIRVNRNDETNFEALNYDNWEICSPACQHGTEQGILVYQFLKDAIIRKYGEAFYEELDAAVAHIRDTET